MFRAALFMSVLILFGSTAADAQPSGQPTPPSPAPNSFQLARVELGAQMSSDGTAGARVGLRR